MYGYGDFSLDPTAAPPNLLRVLMQQGRVLLDSDWNAQVAASTAMLRALARAVTGPWAAENRTSFAPSFDADQGILVQPGAMWVDGLRCVSPFAIGAKSEQPAFLGLDVPGLPATPRFYYLDVWEQAVSSTEDDSLREVALGGPDTTVRSEIRWAIRVMHLDGPLATKLAAAAPRSTDSQITNYRTILNQIFSTFITTNVTLSATATNDDSEDACVVSPESRYRGVENQLYRVEVHQGTHDAFNNPTNANPSFPSPSLVWSRENGSAGVPIEGIDGSVLTVASLGRDERTRIQPGALVQVFDRYAAVTGRPQPVTKVKDVSEYQNLVTLADAPAAPRVVLPAVLRRWDGGPATVRFDANGEMELDLENGITVTLQVSDTNNPNAFQLRAGDYWLIPARTATGDILGPSSLVPPHGVSHAYAPLALNVDTNAVLDLRWVINPAVVAP